MATRPPAIPQHMEALASANRARKRRYAVRRCVVRRRIALPAVIRGELPPAFLELTNSVPVAEVLEWGHRIGETVARKIMLEAEITPSASLKLGHLSPARREALVTAIEQIAPHATAGTERPAEIERELELEAAPGPAGAGAEVVAAAA